jgi:hypothetical protein
MTKDLSSIINAQDRRIRQLETKGVTANAQGKFAGFVIYTAVQYDTTSTFDLSLYPTAKALRVIVQGGGGSGGAAAVTGANETGIGGGGGGGGYAEAFLSIEDNSLAGEIQVVVGAGGVGNTSTGTSGGASWFGGSSSSSTGAYLIGGGGSAGAVGTGTDTPWGRSPGTGGLASIASGLARYYFKLVDGQRPTYGMAITQGVASPDFGTFTFSSPGGMTPLSMGARQYITTAATTYAYGDSASGYGGGGGGSINGEGEAIATDGSDGADGVVIVEVYV